MAVKTRAVVFAAAVVVAAIIVFGYRVWRPRGLPAPDSAAYEQTIREFYRGLAELQVGLIDDAKRDFTAAAGLAPGEPAAWANLGLAHLRLGEFDEASAAVERAASLAPASAAIEFLWGRLETARGRRDEGLVHLRRAVDLDPRNLQARTALIEDVENAGGSNADAEAQQLLDQLIELQPGNSAVLVERARLAAKRGDAAMLRDSVARLGTFAAGWPPEVVEQYRAVQDAAAAGRFADAARSMAFLRNVLARVPAYLEARRRVTPSAELIAEPFTLFLRLAIPVATPSPADDALAFTAGSLGGAGAASASGTVVAAALDDAARPAIFVADGREVRRIDAPGAAWPFPGGPTATEPGPDGVLAMDWNNDFRTDLVAAGAGGVRLFQQSADGSLADVTPAGPPIDATGAWAADIEMDGDLDVVVGVRSAAPIVLRNNGDGTWQSVQPFADVVGTRAFAWGDVDNDGDPDAALIDAAGALHVFANLQAGQFQAMPPLSTPRLDALAIADMNADGVLDLVTLDERGAIQRASWTESGWTSQPLASAPSAASAVAEYHRLLLADIDNNGALDVLASDASRTTVWLAGEDRVLRPVPPLGASIRAVIDVSGDGQLDLVGLANSQPVQFLIRGTRGYHYQLLRPRAQDIAGDQRINSFGIGGDVEVRSGRLVQKQIIAGPVVHLGLGTHTSIDVTRIVWPNGVPQAEFDPKIDTPLVARQRLKGSCPWVFADDGTGMRFVTDFLWRSPLGLRINAQDTAGTTQTEDWVKIRGDQLVARDGAYDVRISAELWETHFIDAVSLMTVDHPNDVSVFVDERFSREAPTLAVHAMRPPEPVAHAWDQAGRDVTDIVSRRDNRYLSTFERGRYQGIATDHFVEFELGAAVAREQPTWLVAYGWIYPTDSSINVAIAQGHAVQPHGLSLEARDRRGRWTVVAPDLGFPAGKNKTILIDLRRAAQAGVPEATHFRLRTNLEIYWDSIGVAQGLDGVGLTTQRIEPAVADLRYRGFSMTRTDRREVPETPMYDRIANTAPQWRDLVGYYTRYGDVRALVARVEDRYVIMNAGDELRLSFTAPAPPPAGWSRDFVLMGDGWEKDGDYNTAFSNTVLPLPAHAHPDYQASSVTPVLEQDPVYQRFPLDWQMFHTRFVSPQRFLEGLTWPEGPAPQ